MKGTVLITGAHGFTGKYVVEELQQDGFQALALESDLMNSAALEREVKATNPDFVIHLAAESRNFGVMARRLVDVNLSGTLNLFAALASKSANLQRVIVASSSAVYGSMNGQTIVEDAVLAPTSLYGQNQ